MAGITYRRVDIKDCFAIMNLYQVASDGDPKDPVLLNQRLLKESIVSPERLWFVAEKDGAILAAFTMMLDEENRLGKINRVVIHPDWQNSGEILKGALPLLIDRIRGSVDVIYTTTRTLTLAQQEMTLDMGFKILGIFPNAAGADESRINGLLVQTRLMTTDAVYWFGFVFCFWIFLRALKKRPPNRWAWMFGVGLLAGLVVGTRWSGLGLIVLVSLVLFKPFLLKREKGTFFFGAKPVFFVILGAVVTYLLVWAIHFSILDQPGLGDRYYRVTGSFTTDIVNVHKKMWEVKNRPKEDHQAASPWWAWATMKKPIYYWSGQGRVIYLWGNPAIWLCSTLLFIVICGFHLLSRVTNLRVMTQKGTTKPAIWVAFLGAVVTLVPWMFSKPAFIYHYTISWFFVLAAGLLWLDHAGWSKSSKLSHQKTSFYVFAGLCFFCFLLILPISYGFAVPESYLSQLVQTVRFFR